MLAYRPTSFGDDVGYSFTVLRLLLFRQLKHRTEDVRSRLTVPDVQGSTSRTALRGFQLESLILAQNERWRQA